MSTVQRLAVAELQTEMKGVGLLEQYLLQGQVQACQVMKEARMKFCDSTKSRID